MKEPCMFTGDVLVLSLIALVTCLLLLPITSKCQQIFSQPAVEKINGCAGTGALRNGDSICFVLKKSLTKAFHVDSIPIYIVKKVQLGRDAHNMQNKSKTPWLTIHGNVLYSLDYRSSIDTPYAEKDIYQHTIQTYLDVTIKDAYPVRIYLTNRFSNSSWFQNFTDLNFQFDPNKFRSNVQRMAIQKLMSSVYKDSLANIKTKLDLLQKQLQGLSNSMSAQSYLQREVERKERALYGDSKDVNVTGGYLPDAKISRLANILGDTGSLAQDFLASAATSMKSEEAKSNLKKAEASVEEKQAKIDSLRNEISVYQNRYATLQKAAENRQQALRQLAAGKMSNKMLAHKLGELNVPDTILPKGYRQLMAVRSLSVGRSVVNYSELSAKNISITGFQAEYNPSFYAAFAAGTVDYRFRNFVVNKQGPKQFLYLLRGGLGVKEGNNVIVTYYAGKRQLYNSSTSVRDSSKIPNYQLMGFTIEGNFKISEATNITAEVAKSSLPYYSKSADKDQGLLSNTFRFNDHSNEAYSIKINSYINYTKTRLTGYFKRYGANFQSFSMFTTGAAQDAWLIKADQALFKKRLLLSASVRENEYTNPFMDSYNQTNTIFKSVQATLRIPKYPSVMIGYYPSSQLTKMGDSYYAENLFYNLVANVNHYYKLDGVDNNTTAIYTQFYNRAQDSNFVYFNTKNILLTHSLLLNGLTLSVTGAAATNTDYNIYSLQIDVQWRLSKIFTIGGGIKYNRQTVYNLEQLGYSGNALLKLNNIGELQLMVDKGFIPGPQKKLVENNIGRLCFIKSF